MWHNFIVKYVTETREILMRNREANQEKEKTLIFPYKLGNHVLLKLNGAILKHIIQ